MDLTLNRWRILILSTLINLCVGAIYAFSVFAGPLQEAHGWSRAVVMMAFTINGAISPIPMILGGKLVDRGGAKLAILLGGSMFGIGFFLTGLSSTPWMLYLSYGVLTGLGQGIAYSGTIGNTIKLFPDKKGLAAGIVTAGYGGGTIIAAPIAGYLIQSSGVASAFNTMGLVYLIIIIGCGLFIKVAPAGYQPVGWTPPSTIHNTPNSGQSLRWTEMIRQPKFYIIAVLFMIGALSGMMVASNASAIGQSMFSLTAVAAAYYVSLYSLSNCLGRVFWGAVSDRLGRYNALICIYGVIAAMLLLIAMTTSTVGFAVALIGIGLCFGGTMGVFPSLVAEKFGMKYYGINYGVTFIGYSMAAFFGPRIAAQVADAHNGDFTQAFYIALAISLFGILLALFFKWYENRNRTVTLKNKAA